LGAAVGDGATDAPCVVPETGGTVRGSGSGEPVAGFLTEDSGCIAFVIAYSMYGVGVGERYPLFLTAAAHHFKST
jgi:hypothetical protein